MKDQADKFSGITVLLQWVIALTMIGMLAFGLYLEELERSPEKGALMGWHKSIGVLLLIFVVPRLIWRFMNGMPKAASVMPAWQHRAASAVHYILLFGTLLMPLSGILMTYGGGHPLEVFGLELLAQGEGNELIDKIGHIGHGLGSKLIIAAVVLHVAGAIKHHFIDKDATLARMFGKRIKLS